MYHKSLKLYTYYDNKVKIENKKLIISMHQDNLAELRIAYISKDDGSPWKNVDLTKIRRGLIMRTSMRA